MYSYKVCHYSYTSFISSHHTVSYLSTPPPSWLIKFIKFTPRLSTTFPLLLHSLSSRRPSSVIFPKLLPYCDNPSLYGPWYYLLEILKSSDCCGIQNKCKCQVTSARTNYLSKGGTPLSPWIRRRWKFKTVVDPDTSGTVGLSLPSCERRIIGIGSSWYNDHS